MNNDLLYVYTYSEILPSPTIIELERRSVQIGKGALGVIYNLPSQPDKIIKLVNFCRDLNNISCRLISAGGLVYEIRDNGTYFFFIPDFIMEVLALTRLNQLLKQKAIFGIPIYYGYNINYNTKEELLLINKYDKIPSLLSFTSEDDINDLVLLLMKIMTIIYLLQKFSRFTHYDLHWDNILMDTNKSIYCVNLQEGSIYFPKSSWPVISDFGSCVFSMLNQSGERVQYVNTTNNKNRYEYSVFNEYFDGLTLFKSIELKLFNDNNQTINVLTSTNPHIVRIRNCFIKSTEDPNKYFYEGVNMYKPIVDAINKNTNGLFTPIEVIGNLVKTFGKLGVSISIDRTLSCTDTNISFGLTNLNIPFLIPKDPVFLPSQMPKYPLLDDINYTLYTKTGPNDVNDTVRVSIQIVKPLTSRNIFSFSLFIAPKYMEAVFKYISDSGYVMDIGQGKNGSDAFYRNYLDTQLVQCFNLIKNVGITPGTWGSQQPAQWGDFGCLILVDKHVLEMPMMTNIGGIMFPWSKISKLGIPINQMDRLHIEDSIRNNISIKIIMNTIGWGTVQDYIQHAIKTNLNNVEKDRMGIYKYYLGSSFDVNVPNTNFINTTPFLGSIVRFMPLQDPDFDVVLFRDAHSTMPNRNYEYDRGWYNVWKGQNGTIPDNQVTRFWMYHGMFYNPPHADGLKTMFAATWGAQKTIHTKENEPIVSAVELSGWIGYAANRVDNFFSRPGYGIDERIMYEMVANPNDTTFLNSTYFVGATWLGYLITGQDIPRKSKIFEKEPIGAIPNANQLRNIRDPSLINNVLGTGAAAVCRELSFIMPSYSVYSDMRCILLYAITQVAELLNNNVQTLTYNQFFDWLDNNLRTVPQTNTIFTLNLLQMLPPRWNIWSFLFGSVDVNKTSIINDLQNFSNIAGGIDIENACIVNKTLWTGNMFNFDKIIFGQNGVHTTNLPTRIALPAGYPTIH